MTRMGMLCAALAVGTLIGWPGDAVAQRPNSNSSYRPSRPTLSPYLQLFRRDPGQILPSYQNFVQPQFEARDFRRQQERNVQNLQRGLNQVQQTGQLEHTSGTIQSGIGSTFQTHSQYFRSHSSNFRTHRTQAPGGAARRGR
jgi:membrane-anchored protein YejM (alkaline phosphatase superfamily)